MKTTIRTLIMAAALWGAAASQAGTWRVEQDGSGDFTTLQPAVDAAASGDTILIGPGWYQETHNIIDESSSSIEVVAYWNELKDLAIIGSGIDSVTIGPLSYSPSGYSPKGIYTEEPNELSVSGVNFVNLYTSVKNYGKTTIENCDFHTGRIGIFLWHASGIIERCDFFGTENSVNVDNCDTVVVADCQFVDAEAYFGYTGYGIVENCTVNGGGLAHYYESQGMVSGNEAVCSGTPGINCSYSQLVVANNRLTGGTASLSIEGSTANVEAYGNVFQYPEYWHFNMLSYGSLRAYNNDIYREWLGPQYFLKCTYYDNPSDAFVDVRNNYWGPNDSTEHFLSVRIWDGNDDPDLKIIVDYMPFSTVPLPTAEQTLDGFKSLFR